MSWFFYAVAAATGMFIKTVDELEDEFKSRHPAKYLLALIYGLLFGYAISFSTFSTLWLAILLAQLITGKIDNQSHLIGFFTALGFALVFGVSEFSMQDFLLLVVFAALDETDLLKIGKGDLRPVLKLAVLVFAVLGRVDYLFALLAFDAAYYATGALLSSKLLAEN